MTPQHVRSFSVALRAGDRLLLFVGMESDFAQRMGDGSDPSPDPNLYRGRIDPAAFETLRDQIPAELLARDGHYRLAESDDQDVRSLELRFEGETQSRTLLFDYPSTTAPPNEVRHVTATAVALTDSWWHAQRGVEADEIG